MPRKAPPSDQRPPISLKEVARLARCSPSAAGAVLNGVENNTRVSESTRRRIEQAGKELGYRRNFLARALRTGRSSLLGFVIGDTAAETDVAFWARLTSGIEQGALARDCDLIAIGNHPSERAFDRGVRMLAERRVDALVIPSLLYSGRQADIDRIQGPIAVAFASFAACRHPQVGIDLADAIHEAVSHLASLGHREVLWLGCSVDGKIQSPSRKQAFDEAIARGSLRSREGVIALSERWPPPAVFIEACAEQAGRILDAASPPTAVFAFNELMGMGVYRALRARGLRVPQDVSVVGFDNIYAQLADPAMTVVGLQLEDIGRMAADLALRQAEEPGSGRHLAAQRHEVRGALIVRGSTGPRRA